MDLITLKKRREDLVKRHDEIQKAVSEFQRNLLVFEGAIEDCDFWIATLEHEAEHAALEIEAPKPTPMPAEKAEASG